MPVSNKGVEGKATDARTGKNAQDKGDVRRSLEGRRSGERGRKH